MDAVLDALTEKKKRGDYKQPYRRRAKEIEMHIPYISNRSRSQTRFLLLQIASPNTNTCIPAESPPR